MQRADDGVERGALLHAGGEVEPAQRRRRLVARRLEHAVEKFDDGLADRRHLRRQAEQGRAGAGVGLVLQPLRHALEDALDEQVELLRNLRDGVSGLARGLERRAPHHVAAGLVEIGEISGEARDQVQLGEDGVDRKADAQVFVQLV